MKLYLAGDGSSHSEALEIAGHKEVLVSFVVKEHMQATLTRDPLVTKNPATRTQDAAGKSRK